MKIYVNGNVVFEQDVSKTPVNRMYLESSRGNHLDIPVSADDYFITFQYASLIAAPLDLIGTPAEVTLANISEGGDKLAKELDGKVQDAKVAESTHTSVENVQFNTEISKPVVSKPVTETKK